MKKRIILILGILLTLAVTLIPISAREGFDIDHYDIDIVAGEDGVYTITETLDVAFNRSLHGIQLQLPKKYKNMTWNVNGKDVTRSYIFPIDHIQVLSDHEVDISDEGSYINLKLGSADYYAAGHETYKIRYQVHTRDLELGGIQTFYWNLISQNWDTVIGKVTFRVTMPKDFDESQLYFYTDLPQDQLSVRLDGRTFSGETLTALNPFEGITVKLDLPEGYFTFPEQQDHLPWTLLLSGVIAAAAVLCFLRWGKDEPLIIPVEFTAPDGISSAEVGTILDGSVNNRDLLSLILDWANRGYLSIEDTERTLQLNKLQDLPESRPTYEKRMFKALFRGRNAVTTEQLNEKFYTHIQQASQDLTAYFKQPDRRITTRASSTLQILFILITPLPLAVASALQWYSLYYSDTAFIWALVVYGLGLASLFVFKVVQQQWRAASAGFRFGMSLLALIFGGVALSVLPILALIAQEHLLLAMLMVLLTVIASLAAVFMSKRTENGQRLYGRVLGLRSFIHYAEEDRLKMLVAQDPTYFYSILPYAYAMGLSDLWSEHFKNLTIEPPVWYYGHSDWTTWYLIHRLNHSMNSFQNSMTTAPHVETTGRGGSFGGGGGGGFTGGGFGGTSGSGW